MLPEGVVFVRRKGTITTPQRTALLISRRTCLDSLAKSVKIRTMTFDCSIASMIEPAQSAPGRMSRGAYQQRQLSCSSRAQTASATALSFVE